jgi:cell division protein ZapE
MRAGPRQAYEALVAQSALRADDAQRQVVEHLERLHSALRHHRTDRPRVLSSFARADTPPRGLYIHGGVGRGKSMLMDLFFAHAPLRLKRCVHFHGFMLETHAAISAWRKLGAKERARRAAQLKLKARGTALDDPMLAVGRMIAREAVLLCFDEFEVRDIADAMILGRLFSVLFEQGVVVVATSNQAPDRLYEQGLNRQLFLPFVALLNEQLDVLCLDGSVDYRLERLKELEVYHAPLGADADRAMDAAWRALTGRQAGERRALDVQGRKLAVPQAADRIARFSFSELCEQPLGAADYLALAQEFHTLLVDRVPRMSTERRNEARRFATLIDALYEARVKLVVSAECPPDQLYPAGDGAFEFRRTVSRLFEMKSADYMAEPHAPRILAQKPFSRTA